MHNTNNEKRDIMTKEIFGAMYLKYEKNIKKVLNSKKIFDQDLFDDTYIALFEDSQKNEIQDFEAAFLCFYTNRYKWKKKQDSSDSVSERSNHELRR